MIKEEKFDGYIKVTEKYSDLTIIRTNIFNEKGEEALNKKCGDYTTIWFPYNYFEDDKIYDTISEAIGKEMKELFKTLDIQDKDEILVVGIGNSNDACNRLGTNVCEGIRKIMPEENYKNDIRPVYSIIPGIESHTKINTTVAIRAIVETIKPKAVIAIDAFATDDINNLFGSIQMSNTGLEYHWASDKINQETLGVPVIAIGVSTVINIKHIAKDEIKAFLGDKMDDLYLTDKNIELHMELLSWLISVGITAALYE